MAVNWTGSHESKLLRMLVGYLHFLTVEHTAHSRYGKKASDLSEEQKDELAKEIFQRVLDTASDLTPEMLGMPPGALSSEGKSY